MYQKLKATMKKIRAYNMVSTKKPKKQSNFKLENIAIIDSIFKRLSFESMFDYKSKQNMILSILNSGKQIVEAGRENDNPLYIFTLKRGIKLSPPDDKDFIVILIEAIFEVSYELTSDKPTAKELELFMENNVKNDTFDSWENFVNLTCGLMGISTIPKEQLK